MKLAQRLEGAASWKPRFKIGDEVILTNSPRKHTQGVVEDMEHLYGPPFRKGVWLKVREKDNNFRWVHQSLVSSFHRE
jgi:hypothetical protein